MKFIQGRVRAGEILMGAWCNLCSSITVEMAARAGYDWILVDQEHGPGDSLILLQQIQAVEAWSGATIVRVRWNEMPLIKRVLDLGAAGVMVPYIQTAEEARQAVASVLYPPRGMRGVASSPRCAGYGADFTDYFETAHEKLTTVVQIETGLAAKNAGEIAAVEGVDVLFVGPLDLSVNLGMKGQFADGAFRDVLAKVGQAAREHGKAAGILLPNPELIPTMVEMGYTFLAAGSDGGMVRVGMANNLQAMRAGAGIPGPT